MSEEGETVACIKAQRRTGDPLLEVSFSLLFSPCIVFYNILPIFFKCVSVCARKSSLSQLSYALDIYTCSITIESKVIFSQNYKKKNLFFFMVKAILFHYSINV